MFENSFGSYKNVECGLVSVDSDGDNKGPIPLESVSIEATVVHAVAQVELTQVYVNKEDQPIEAIYFFPLDSNAGVTYFRAEIGGRTILGVVKPEEEAKEQYKKAIKNNQTAFLCESNKPDIFKVRIGSLKPNAQVKVVIGYVTEVKNEKGSYAQRFFIPTTVAPRYISPDDKDKKSNKLKKMTFSERSPAPLSITVNVTLDGGMKSIESPTHNITVSGIALQHLPGHTGRAKVTLTGKTTDMDRDFVLLITPIEVHTPRLYIEENGGSTALMTHLIPSFKLDDQKVELIFVLDRSGSMMGRSMEMAKKALQLFLHSAPAECYFNVVGFGSSFTLLFPQSVKYNDENLKKAIDHAKSLRADLGGTELHAPLEAVFAKPPVSGYLRQIFVLTDGEIGDTERVLGLTKANAHLGRVFSLGIGDACSHYLVDGLAQAGGGTASFVTYKESIDAKILQQLKNAIQPSLSDVRVEWTGLSGSSVTVAKDKPKGKSTKVCVKEPSQDAETKKQFKQVPERVPPIYDGTQLLVFGVFENDLPTGAKITAESPDGPLSVEMKFGDGHKLGSNEMLHKLAAVKLVRELELKISGSKDKSKIAELKKEVVAISCKQGISSSYTSFLAIDSENKKATNENWVMQTRHVPNQYAHGWHGGSAGRASIFTPRRGCRGGGSSARYCGSSGSSSAQKRRRGRSSVSGGGSSSSTAKRYRGSSSVSSSAQHRSASASSSGSSSASSAPKALPKNASSEDRLHALVGTQSSNGSFFLNEAFANAIGEKLKDLQKEAKKQGVDESTFATALALEYFALKLNGLKDSWELIAVKATKWLTKNCTKHASVRTAAGKYLA